MGETSVLSRTLAEWLSQGRHHRSLRLGSPIMGGFLWLQQDEALAEVGREPLDEVVICRIPLPEAAREMTERPGRFEQPILYRGRLAAGRTFSLDASELAIAP